MSDDRKRWQSLADQAARDPSRAPAIARLLAEETRAACSGAGSRRFPPGYVYSGADRLVATFRDVRTEPLSTPLTKTSTQPVSIRVPRDLVVLGVSAWCQMQAPEFFINGEFDAELPFQLNMSASSSYRDLFSVAWDLDGKDFYATDGTRSLLLPAAVQTGTGQNPRAMYWPIQRNRNLNVYCRNITNALIPPELVEGDEIELRLRLSAVSVVFHCLRLDGEAIA